MSSHTFASTQSIVLPCGPDQFEVLAQPDHLQRMLLDYFSVAERCAFGLVRIEWRHGKPRFVLIWPCVTLLAMGEPATQLDSRRCAINVPVEGGLVVDPRSTGRLSIVLERRVESVHASVELVGYQPRFSRLASVRWLYAHTQAIEHEWVGRRYLHQLLAAR